MGTEVLLPLALSALAGGASYVNSQNVAHKQDQTLAAQIRASAEKQRQADARTAQVIQNEAKQTDTQDKAKSLSEFNKMLALKAPNATASLTAPGAVSSAYKKAGSDAALGISGYGNQVADNISSIDAPEQQRQRDQITNLDPYRNDIGLIARKNQGDNFLYNLKLQGIRPNPFLSLISGVAGGGANALAKGAFGGAQTVDDVSGLPFNWQKAIPGAWNYDPNAMGVA